MFSFLVFCFQDSTWISWKLRHTDCTLQLCSVARSHVYVYATRQTCQAAATAAAIIDRVKWSQRPCVWCVGRQMDFVTAHLLGFVQYRFAELWQVKAAQLRETFGWLPHDLYLHVHNGQTVRKLKLGNTDIVPINFLEYIKFHFLLSTNWAIWKRSEMLFLSS